MKSYVNCPICGTKLIRAEEVKEMEFQCFKCKNELLVNVSQNGITVNISSAPKEHIRKSIQPHT